VFGLKYAAKLQKATKYLAIPQIISTFAARKRF